MSALDALLREDLRDFTGYRSARSERVEGIAWLNANESPWPSPSDPGERLRRYPTPQPQALREAAASLYGVAPEQVLATRGSDEGIDLLLRACCMPGASAVVIAPPVFGMYAVCARLHGARVLEVPLLDGAEGFRVNMEGVATAARAGGARIVFLCSPGNPTGDIVPLTQIANLARQLQGQAVVVVDEAYGEYASGGSAVGLLGDHGNVVVLRTLSKAHALAAARIGFVLAAPTLVQALQRCQAPYPLPVPSVDAALAALAPNVLGRTRARARRIQRTREGLAAALRALPCVARVYRSEGNFLLLRFHDADAALASLANAGVVVRDMRGSPLLGDALRITVGGPRQNAMLLAALS